MLHSNPRCLAQIPNLPFRRLYSSRTIQEYDVLYLRQQGPKRPRWHLTAPLRPNSLVKLGFGASIPADELVGRNLLDRVQDSHDNRVVLHEASLASYILNADDRLATPIYPHDANTIVSLLDLHPSRPSEQDPNALPLEIFEAGTGMGSLTLHLARAIYAANPPFPPALLQSLCEAPYERTSPELPPTLDLTYGDQAAYDAYASSRRAVLHTLDLNPKHTRAAYKLVRNFRRGQYLPSIDFHTGTVNGYISARLAATNDTPFLSHAILDLPSAQENAPQLIKALLPGALLIVFNPSISQVAEFQAWSMTTRQPLQLDRAIELPPTTVSEGLNDSGGGRLWDIRTVLPKNSEDEARMVQVMRPKVGDRVAGGGFVGVFRKRGDDGQDTEMSGERECTEKATETDP